MLGQETAQKDFNWLILLVRLSKNPLAFMVKTLKRLLKADESCYLITTLQLKTAKNVRGLVSMGERGYGLLRTPKAVAMVTFVKG